ncbi:MAG: glycosyltransferase family 4 protein [Bacteroidales bacterium]|nr:glycosyltransferase family 4 protein [Bacteroidales bacterium]
MKIKKYLVYTENHARGGANKYLIDFINALPDFEIKLISNYGGIYPDEIAQIKKSFSYQQYNIVGFHLKPFFNNNGFLSNLLNKLFRKFFSVLSFFYNIVFFIIILTKIKPDCVHIFNGGLPGGISCLSLAIASRLLKIKNIMTLLSVPLLKNNHFILKFYGYIALKSSNYFIVNSKAIKKELIYEHNVPDSKITIIYNGLDSNQCGNQNRFQNYIFERFGCTLNKNEKIITCVGRFDELKGQKFLISAIEKLKNQECKYKVIFVGKGPLLNDIIKYTNELQLQDIVWFIEYYPYTIYDVLENSDIFVFPTLHEGFSYALLEAMKSNCAIIATNICGNVEAIDDNITGVCVNPMSPDEIALKLSLYLTSNKLIEKHSKASLEKFKNLFTIKIFEKNVVKFIINMR